MLTNIREGEVVPWFGSQKIGSLESLTVKVPPYCGVPRLSHQFPVLEVVTVTAAEVVTVEAGAVVTIEFVVVDAAVVTVEDGVVAVDVRGVVEELQDARTRDIIRMPDSINQTLLFFIKSSLTNKMLLGNGNKKSFFKYFYYPDPTERPATPLAPITPKAPSREGPTTTFEL
jgi:hypothetical protein